MPLCCLQKCRREIDIFKDSLVDVKCDPQRSGKIRKSDLTRKWFALWSKKGDAVFHIDCWNELTQSKLSIVERARVRQAKKTAEFHTSYKEVEEAAVELHKLISSSNYPIAFTGAGISTSAGIGDFRGKSGKWTQEDRQTRDEDENEEEGVEYEELRPTLTHELLVYMVAEGHLKHVISQNGDGLHQLSGFTPGDNLSELHGNVFVERCERCEARFTRQFYVLDDSSSEILEAESEGGNLKSKSKLKPHVVRCPTCKLTHRTGRRCSACHVGYLQDTIINFGDQLEDSILERAKTEASKSDLVLCLGSTLQVTPAADLVMVNEKGTAKRKQIVVCNRQRTEVDGEARVRVFGDCDRLMEMLGRLIMGIEGFQSWLNEKKSRHKGYDLQRKISGK